MQQTDKYKLNLIEMADTFPPDALNENMRKVEVHLDTVRAEAKAGDTAEVQIRSRPGHAGENAGGTQGGHWRDH